MPTRLDRILRALSSTYGAQSSRAHTQITPLSTRKPLCLISATRRAREQRSLSHPRRHRANRSERHWREIVSNLYWRRRRRRRRQKRWREEVMYRFFATIRGAGGRAGNPPFPIPLFHSPLRSSSSSSAFCLDPHLHSAALMEAKGFRSLPICNCNRRTGNMTGERNLRMHRLYPSPSRSPSSDLPCYFPSRPFRLRRFQVGTVLPKCRKSSVRVRQRHW